MRSTPTRSTHHKMWQHAHALPSTGAQATSSYQLCMPAASPHVVGVHFVDLCMQVVQLSSGLRRQDTGPLLRLLLALPGLT
jgi:hypothetical protein